MWTKTTSELPELGKRVLVFSESKGTLLPIDIQNICVWRWCGDDVGWIMEGGTECSATVTHWMPLPDKP